MTHLARRRFFLRRTGQHQFVRAVVLLMLAQSAVMLVAMSMADSWPRILECQSPGLVACAANVVVDDINWGVILGQTVVILASAALSAVISHRTFGPTVPILRQIEAMIAGDMSKRVVLRPGDHLVDISARLNELAEKLAKSHPKTCPSHLGDTGSPSCSGMVPGPVSR